MKRAFVLCLLSFVLTITGKLTVIFNAEAKCACAEGVRLPERSEPEGPQGAARRRVRRGVLELARYASSPGNSNTQNLQLTTSFSRVEHVERVKFYCAFGATTWGDFLLKRLLGQKTKDRGQMVSSHPLSSVFCPLSYQSPATPTSNLQTLNIKHQTY